MVAGLLDGEAGVVAVVGSDASGAAFALEGEGFAMAALAVHLSAASAPLVALAQPLRQHLAALAEELLDA